MSRLPSLSQAFWPEQRDAFLRRLLFDEIVPATDLPSDAAEAFAHSVVERFQNPWLDHEWRVILTNQEAKLRIRVVPLISAFVNRRGRHALAARARANRHPWRPRRPRL